MLCCCHSIWTPSRRMTTNAIPWISSRRSSATLFRTVYPQRRWILPRFCGRRRHSPLGCTLEVSSISSEKKKTSGAPLKEGQHYYYYNYALRHISLNIKRLTTQIYRSNRKHIVSAVFLLMWSDKYDGDGHLGRVELDPLYH